MSSSYSNISKTNNILHTMLNVASTESFAVVREQFFKSYLAGAISQGPSTPYPPKKVPDVESAEEERFRKLQESLYTPEHLQTPWEKAAKSFAGMLSGISKHYAGSGIAESKTRAEQIQAVLQKPGTPYEKVGYVLAWFKEWRVEQRKLHSRHPSDAHDTQHHKLQEAMTTLLLDVSYAMIADSKNAPAKALHVLRSQPKKAVCSDPTPMLKKPDLYYQYTSSKNVKDAKNQARREKWLENSSTYREQLEHASPWTIVMDWSWKKTLCFTEGETVQKKTVPPIYTLGKYFLTADESTWDRQCVCDALVMEKTLSSFGGPAQSGLDIGLAERPAMDVSAYEAWWKEQERYSAKDWRYIRRSSVMLSRVAKFEHITVGDAVARIKKFGPAEVVNGAFIHEDTDIKALLLDRIQPELGDKYTALKQIEDAMGSMPEVIIESLNSTLKKNADTHTKPELDMGNIFG